MTGSVTLIPVRGIPEVRRGDNVGQLIAAALLADGEHLTDGDVVVVTSKVISKADGLTRDSEDREALVLQESRRVVTERSTSTGGFTRVVASAAGPVMAGAGIDASNTGPASLLLLPHDPDAAAANVHAQLSAAIPEQRRFGVVLSDTAGRPWRAGLTDFALGLAGVRALDDLRGRTDTDGRPMSVTVRCLADEIAAAADLVKGKLDGFPVAIVRGLDVVVASADSGRAADLVRSGPDDWFALGRAEAVRDALGVIAGSPTSESCGIASVHPETIYTRMHRAIKVALADSTPPAVGASHHDGRITLTSADPIRLGRAWGRLDVALAGEGLRSERPDDRATEEDAGPAGTTSITLLVSDA